MKTSREHKDGSGISTVEFMFVMGIIVILFAYIMIFSRQINELDRASRAGDYIANNKSSIVPFIEADSSGQLKIKPDLVVNSLSASLEQAYQTIQGNATDSLMLVLKMNPQDCPAGFDATSDSVVPKCYDSGNNEVPCCMKKDGNNPPVPCDPVEALDLARTSRVCYTNFPAVGVMSIKSAAFQKDGDLLYSDSPGYTGGDPIVVTEIYGGGSDKLSWQGTFDTDG